jgi:hypothetical protein
MDVDATWMWNGLRGGLVVPASAMVVIQADPAGVIARWEERGADPELVIGDAYYAYELQGYYAYSTSKDDTAVQQRLRDRVKLLVADAPSLAISVDAKAPIRVVDLAAEYRRSASPPALTVETLATCGRNLTPHARPAREVRRAARERDPVPAPDGGTAGPRLRPAGTVRHPLRSCGGAVRPQHARLWSERSSSEHVARNWGVVMHAIGRHSAFSLLLGSLLLALGARFCRRRSPLRPGRPTKT